MKGFLKTILGQVALALGLVVAITAAGTWYNYREGKEAEAHLKEIKEEAVKNILMVAAMRADIINVQQYTTDAALMHDEGGVQKADESRQEFLKKLKHLAGHTEEFRSGEQIITQRIDALYKAGFAMYQAFSSGDRTTGEELMGDLDQASESLTTDFMERRERFLELTKAQLDEVDAMMQQMLLHQLMALAAAAFAALMLFVFVIRRAILRPVAEGRQAIEEILKDPSSNAALPIRGNELDDLFAPLNQLFDGFRQNAVEAEHREAENAKLLADFEVSNEQNLRQIEALQASIKTLIAESETSEKSLQKLDDLSAKLADARDDLQRISAESKEYTGMIVNAMGSVSQKSANQLEQIGKSTEEVAQLLQAIEEIRTTITEISQSIASVSDQSISNEKLATDAFEDMEQLNSNVGNLTKITRNVAEIAQQLNLLALNAAVEAARAGEHGKGFAVVAGEVRTMATNVGKLSAEIISGMEGIVTNSKTTLEALRQTKESAAGINKNAGEISQSVAEQQGAVEDLSSNAASLSASMEEVSQEVEESAREIGAANTHAAKVSDFSKDSQTAVNEVSNSITAVDQGVGEIKESFRRVMGVVNDLQSVAESRGAANAPRMVYSAQEYGTGHKGIDDQHAELFVKCNELHEAMLKGRGKERIQQILDDLADYTKMHFEYEITEIKKAGWGGAALAAHLTLHDKLLSQVTEMIGKFKRNPDTVDSNEVLNFLRNWLDKHIKEEDREGYANDLGWLKKVA
jgi:methyl-accepting chemotaxis protein